MQIRRLLAAVVLATAIPRAGVSQVLESPQARAATGGALTGVVRDSAGEPVPFAEVSIPGRSARTETDGAGRFLLGGIEAGTHDVLIRRIGYYSVNFEWPAQPGVRVDIAVRLTPLARGLDPVRVYAREASARRGNAILVGTIVDALGMPIAGADVYLAGSSRRTYTREDGTFAFRSLPEGTYSVRARHIGYSPVTRAMRLEADDEREIVLRLDDLPHMLDAIEVRAASGYARHEAIMNELDRRLQWKSSTALVIGPDQLQARGRMALDVVVAAVGGLALDQLQAMRGTRGADISRLREEMRIAAGLPAARRSSLTGPADPTDACILVDGDRVIYGPLRMWDASQVELVEFYPPGTELTGSLRSRMDGHDRCRGEGLSHPPYYVVWLKGSR